MKTEYSRKGNFQGYEHAFSCDQLNGFEEDRFDGYDNDMETIRGLYGYVFTEDYKKGIILDTLSMDYWNRKDDYLEQELLVFGVIESSSDGIQDDPFSVICVGQEYELQKRSILSRK